jgi:NADH-quinone oxidoreductase subunit L
LPLPSFEVVPLAASLVVALGGLFLGWWIYGKKSLDSEQPDPLQAPLGPLYTFLANKWYWDELYDRAFVEPTKWVARTFVYEWTDRGVIDGTLHLIARVVFRIGAYMRWFEQTVISGGVDKAKDGALWIAQESRGLQTGKIQEYVLWSVIIGWVLAAAILVINAGYLDNLIN